jgi:hypothetical protein
MSTHAVNHRATHRARISAVGVLQLRWLAGGLALGFFVPFLFADLLDMQRDLYYGVYAVSVVGFFMLWARATGQSLAEMVGRRRLLAVALGLGCAAVLALMVLRVEDATARPDNLTVAGAVLWRGVVYGATDGLLLSAFPILAVFAAFAGTRLRKETRGKLLIGCIAILASLAMTAAYHVGYSAFRSSQLRSPMTGDVAWSIPTLVTLNPIGAPIAHIGLHTSAVLHSYKTDLFLPPHE